MSIARYTNGCPVKQANEQDREVLGIWGGFLTDFMESWIPCGNLEPGGFCCECLSCTVLTFLANCEYLCPALGFALPVQMSFSLAFSATILLFAKLDMNHSLYSFSNNLYMLLGRTEHNKNVYNPHKTELLFFSRLCPEVFQCFICLNCTSSPQ